MREASRDECKSAAILSGDGWTVNAPKTNGCRRMLFYFGKGGICFLRVQPDFKTNFAFPVSGQPYPAR